MDKKQLEELIEQGLTLEEIVHQLDTKISQVRFWCGKFNLTIKFKRKCCFICKITKDISNFYLKENKKSYSSYCSNCSQKQSKIKRKAKDYKQDFVDYKGGACEVCGYDKCLSALEFHHKDPSKKDFGITEYKSKKLNEEIKQELDKCALLCANCHREEHNKLYGSKTINNITILTNKIKYCKSCNTNKSLSEFYLCSNKKKDIKEYFSYCKQCLIDKTIAIQKRIKREAVEYKGNKCNVCDYNKLDAALEFHHLDPTKKDFAISNIIKGTGYINEQIKLELDKCVLLCANCHREVHAGKIDIFKHLSTIEFNEDFKFVDKPEKLYLNYNSEIKFVRIDFSNCIRCNKIFSKTKYKEKKFCSLECYNKSRYKVNWNEINLKELWPKNSLVAVAKMLGVSNNTVKKHLIKQGLKKL